MEEVVEGIFKLIARIILPVVKLIVWIVWELMCETILWYIGWVVLRLVTFGYYPKEGLSEEDKALPHTLIFTMLVGLITPICFLYMISDYIN